MINDRWLLKQGMTLYHLLVCTDILISNYSSVLLDYILLDQADICFSKDLENYKSTQGHNFKDIENWLPSKFLKDNKSFLSIWKLCCKTSLIPLRIKEKRD